MRMKWKRNMDERHEGVARVLGSVLGSATFMVSAVGRLSGNFIPFTRK